MYQRISNKQSALCIIGFGFTVALGYVLYEKYYKDGLKKDK